jgi:hypothetical protein
MAHLPFAGISALGPTVPHTTAPGRVCFSDASHATLLALPSLWHCCSYQVRLLRPGKGLGVRGACRMPTQRLQGRHLCKCRVRAAVHTAALLHTESTALAATQGACIPAPQFTVCDSAPVAFPPICSGVNSFDPGPGPRNRYQRLLVLKVSVAGGVVSRLV